MDNLNKYCYEFEKLNFILRKYFHVTIYIIKDRTKEMEIVSKLKLTNITGGIYHLSNNKSLTYILLSEEFIWSLYEVLKNSFSSLSPKLPMIYNDIKKIQENKENTLHNEFNYDNVLISDNSLTFLVNITPDKIIERNKVFSIPSKYRKEITRIEVLLSSDQKIISVKINQRHPNAKKTGEFCIGDLKGFKLTKDTADKIKTMVKVYRLDNCYWKPDYTYK